MFHEENPGGPGVDVQLVERSAELSLQVSVAGHDFDPNTMETKPIDLDGLVNIVANLVRPYTYQYPGAEGRVLIDRLKARLEDVWHGRG